jgi:hypothetical protein
MYWTGIRHIKFFSKHLIYFKNIITDVTIDWKYNSYERNKSKQFSSKNYLENLQGDEKLTLK